MVQSGNDIQAHEQTYEAFINLLKWTVPVTALITFIVVLLIA